jgi:LemA protein
MSKSKRVGPRSSTSTSGARDLVPNLVATVKGEAKFEQGTLTKVIEARSKATSIQATPELVNDPAAFQKFQAAQGELTGALSRLMAVSENYPNLRANQGFRDLSAQLEGTENRITVARNRYIASVQAYNVTVRSFPSNLTAKVMGYKEKANFATENEKEISKPPSVGFRYDTRPSLPAPRLGCPSDHRPDGARHWQSTASGVRARLVRFGRGASTGPSAHRASHRPDWNADCRAEGHPGANVDSIRSQKRKPTLSADGRFNGARGVEQFALRGRGEVEARPNEGR